MANENPSVTFTFKTKKFSENVSDDSFDTVLVVGSECLEVQAHRTVLSASSRYFCHLFWNNTTSSEALRIELKDTDSSTFRSIINFMYSGCIELSLKTVENILRTAVFLKMGPLVDGCIDFILEHVTFSNCLKCLRLAKELNFYKLKKKSLKCAYSNFEKVSKEQEILLLDEMELKDLLFNENPSGNFEELVLQAISYWIEYDKSNREHLRLQLLSMVRYKFLTPFFIVKNRRSICKTIESYELVSKWLEWHCLQDKKYSVVRRRKLTAITCSEIGETINIQTFDTKIKNWTPAKQIPLWKHKEEFSMIVIEDKLIIVGGQIDYVETNSVECLDLNTFKWTSLPPMRQVRNYCQTACINGNLCVFGGTTEFGYITTLEMFSFQTNEWQDLEPLSQPSRYSEIAACDGVLYIADFVNSCLQSYDVSTNLWTSKELTNNIEIDSFFGFAAVSGFLYLIGGWDGRILDTVKRYNLADDSWSEMAPLPESRFLTKTVVVEGKILICSGEPLENLVQEFDPKNNSWSTLSNSKLMAFPKSLNNVCILMSDLF